jgi:hypothetical protein
LLAAHPAREGGDEDLPGLKNRRHPQIVAEPRRDRQLPIEGGSG